MTRKTTTLLLRISAVLWVVWGLVHVLAGVMTVSQGTTDAVRGIADGVAPEALAFAYPAAAGAIINQHGFNLGWIGLTTLIGAFWVWRGSATAVFVVALVGWLADLGYFLFLDLGGFVRFVPGTVMTIVSTAAVVLSFVAHFRGTKVSSTA